MKENSSVPYTCDQIDGVISAIKSNRWNHYWWSEMRLVETMEDIRKSNSELRDFGNEMYDKFEESDNENRVLYNTNEDLENKVDKLENEVERLKKEMIEFATAMCDNQIKECAKSAKTFYSAFHDQIVLDKSTILKCKNVCDELKEIKTI